MFVQGRQIFTVPVIGIRGSPMVKIFAAENWSALLSLEQIDNLELEFKWRRGVISTKEKGLALKAPIRKGKVLGKAVISLEGKIMGEVDMVAAANVGLYYLWLPALGGFLLALLATAIIIRRRRPPVRAR